MLWLLALVVFVCELFNGIIMGRNLIKDSKELLAKALPYLEKVYAAEPNNRGAKDALRIIYYNFNDAAKMEALGD